MNDVGSAGRAVFIWLDEDDEGGILFNTIDEEEEDGGETGPAGGNRCCSAVILLVGVFLAALGLGAGNSSSFALLPPEATMRTVLGVGLLPSAPVTVA